MAARNPHQLGLLAQFLKKEGDFVKSANRLEALDLALSQSKAISLSLMDRDGFTDVLRTLQMNSGSANTLSILPKQSAIIEQLSLDHGMQSTLVKLLVVRKFLGIVRSLLRD